MGPEPLPSSVPRYPAPTELALRQAYMLQPAAERAPQAEDDDSALTLSDLLNMVLKHKWTLLLVVLVTTTIAGINTFLQRPTYRPPPCCRSNARRPASSTSRAAAPTSTSSPSTSTSV
jgi:hypothetical protein